ncbi:hypothetical protein NDU88_007627 [Pleurodeles waltl]|uniref:Uncharacterized protein n=1 Tax=Pleurodeles waltl TaxID=8319 RepID=A0AAV7RRH1_PLEWA|nr:hypothetical protein NDU88_007627 [Pleurodeles waltl]
MQGRGLTLQPPRPETGPARSLPPPLSPRSSPRDDHAADWGPHSKPSRAPLLGAQGQVVCSALPPLPQIRAPPPAPGPVMATRAPEAKPTRSVLIRGPQASVLLRSLTRSAGSLPAPPMAPPGHPGLSRPLGLTARPSSLGSSSGLKGPMPPAPPTRERSPDPLSGTPAVSTHPPVSRGAQETAHRGRYAFNEAQAAELAEMR